MKYTYIGDRMSNCRGIQCDPVLRTGGKCIRGRNGNMLVTDGVKKYVVIARLLRKNNTNQLIIHKTITIMKKLVLLGFIALMYGCMMIAQIPRQYVYVDENCEATLPDYSELVVVKDNCGEYILIQAPAPGEIISTETIVTITAIDAMGNMASAEFPVSVLDTIPPNLYYNDTMIVQLNPEWKGYTDHAVEIDDGIPMNREEEILYREMMKEEKKEEVEEPTFFNL